MTKKEINTARKYLAEILESQRQIRNNLINFEELIEEITDLPHSGGLQGAIDIMDNIVDDAERNNGMRDMLDDLATEVRKYLRQM